MPRCIAAVIQAKGAPTNCEDQSNSDRWTVRRYTDSGQLEDCSSSVWGSQTGSTCTISYTSTSDTGVYWCHSESGENSHPVNITASKTQTGSRSPFMKTDLLYSMGCCRIRHKFEKRPKAKVTIKPDQHVFRGETVTLRCDIDGEGVTSWQYSWYKDGSADVFSEQQEHTFRSVTESDAGKYSCYGAERGGSRTSNISDAVTLTVSVPRAVLSVSPQKWLTEGDPVTLICEVYGSSTGWTFSWYTVTVSSDNRYNYQLLSDSSRGAGGNYTVSSADLNHTGVYMCRAEREKPAYKTWYSNSQLIWVTGVSPPVSLIISPSRTQHFSSVSLSLSCEDQSNSDRWTVRRYTDSGQLEDCSSSVWGSQTGSTCTISSTITSHTGVYWCQSESGENSHPVNITVHSGVILESPVHPVTEGDTLTLHCLYQHSTPPNLTADFYKDGSLIQNQTTQMIISTVSKSHEGFYYCKHPERGESPKSWISVRDIPTSTLTVQPQSSLFTGDSVTLRCEVDQSWVGRVFLWSKDSNTEFTGAAVKTIDSVKVSDGGEYRGETVTLRCDIDGEGVTSWQYSWYKDGSLNVSSKLQEHTFSPVNESDAGKYSCYGAERGGSRTSNISDAVTLTVSGEAQAVLSVSPQKWLTEGDPVTLICEVNSSSTGWTFSWYSLTVSSDSRDNYKLLSDSSRGAGGNYTVSSAALKHTGVYVCRAERGKPAYNTTYSNKQQLWVTGVSPPVSLIISPSRTQHFTSVSLSLSCEDQSNSDRWTVRRYTDSWGLEDCSSSAPVHPVTEGDTLTLHCLYKHSTPPNLTADFYKDGSLIQNQTTQMIISTVSKSLKQGFYYCKQPERGESPKSWISVRVPRAVLSVSPQKWLTEGDPVTLICEVYGSSTGWTFSWYTVTVSSDSSDHYKLLSDSSRGAGGNYTVSSAALKHTGVYVCRAERGKPAYNTTYSNKQPLWVTGVSPPVSLIISPSRTQHFTSVSLSLSCEDQSNSDRWTVRSYTDSERLEDCSSSLWGSQTGSTCTINSTNTSDTGVYWCESESGENSHPVNITVHCDFSFRILDLCSSHTQFCTGSLSISASDSRADLQVLQNER
ncbi:Fc receptor-like protein 5 [Labeo rohita]|uniref:Fc receptor-like protein 5 n=1 Tax=Labeo rohita TaxID=84645 RepID=A0ABQ8L3U1_LABRO|nr:Fc receptor-like protein 5 [Labeo rohita]